jgi:hypothetical protein
MNNRKVGWKRNVVSDKRNIKNSFNPIATFSLSSPKDSRRGCLCRNKNIYSTKCCDGNLPNQGIGLINAPSADTLAGSFSLDFSNDFD